VLEQEGASKSRRPCRNGVGTENNEGCRLHMRRRESRVNDPQQMLPRSLRPTHTGSHCRAEREGNVTAGAKLVLVVEKGLKRNGVIVCVLLRTLGAIVEAIAPRFPRRGERGACSYDSSIHSPQERVHRIHLDKQVGSFARPFQRNRLAMSVQKVCLKRE
jgi:hypothetical protein